MLRTLLTRGVRTHRARKANRAALIHMSDAQLRDIGLSRGDDAPGKQGLTRERY